MERQAMGADRTPVFTLPSQTRSLEGFEHPVGLILAQWLATQDGLKLQGTTDLEQISHVADT
ncbi:hypothetical protein D3C78_1588840 [compost metagenome]